MDEQLWNQCAEIRKSLENIQVEGQNVLGVLTHWLEILRSGHAEQIQRVCELLEAILDRHSSPPRVPPPGDRERSPHHAIFSLPHVIALPTGPLNTEELCAWLGAFGRTLGSDHARFLLAERLSMAVYPELKVSEFGRSWLDDKAFFRDYQRFMDSNNWHSADRKYTLWQLARWAGRLPGEFAECGVYKGGSAIYLCQEARRSGKHVHLFDSFEGLPTPSELDGSHWRKGNLAAPLEDVQSGLGEYACFSCHRGWIPDRFAEVADESFCLVHIDVDLYEPTRESLGFFHPRLVPGGMLVLDDHGFTSCPGATKAAEEFCAAAQTVVINLPTGQGLILKDNPAGAIVST